jgi:hypothetical protein
LKEWEPYFKGFCPGWYFRNKTKWRALMKRFKFKTRQCRVVSQYEVFPSREHFEEYVRSWFSYLGQLPEHLKEIFFQQIINRYLEIVPILKTGKVPFRFSRLDLVALKVTL